MNEQIQYIGARYVIKIYENKSNPSTAEWDSNTFYEPLTMVTYEYNSYLSKKAVPATIGNPADNPEYWVQTGYYSGQIMELQNRVSDLQQALNNEATQRSNTDRTLNNLISELTISTSAEVNNLKSADTTIQGNLNAEISTRETADSALSDAITAETNARAGADTLINARIDEIIAPSGEAPSPAEVTDARIGANGVTYTSLGSAIRSQVTNLQDAILENLNDVINCEGIGIKSFDLVVGMYDPTTETISHTYDSRISNIKPISYPYDVRLYTPSGFQCYPYKIVSDEITPYGSWTNSNSYFTIPANDECYFYIKKNPEDTSETADINVWSAGFKLLDFPLDIMYGVFKNCDFLKVENGAWTYGAKTANSNRIRLAEAITVNKGDRIAYSVSNLTCAFCYMSNISADSWEVENVSGVGVYCAPDDGVVVANIRNSGGTAISVADWNGLIINTSAFSKLILNISKNGKSPKSLPNIVDGKNLYIYRFGTGANDWCWVRTPENYKHRDTTHPHQFVICNHGNGWVMDGTEEKANWTKRTMYVPLTDPDYIAHPTEYNGTADSSLWYSNPTIEKLLEYGYVVCGCENYGDSLYGNNNCRNACVAFFEHMTDYYNVQKRCYMIGSSNGGLTSLNAAYLLQGKIKAMCLLYPITCLVNQYEHNTGMRTEIRSAYGIENPDITLSELAVAVATHDPLTVDVVSGVKVGVFPPTKLWYSPDDEVVDCDYNTIPFAQMLSNSNKVVSTVEVSGEHGDHSHFNPEAILDWFKAN